MEKCQVSHYCPKVSTVGADGLPQATIARSCDELWHLNMMLWPWAQWAAASASWKFGVEFLLMVATQRVVIHISPSRNFISCLQNFISNLMSRNFFKVFFLYWPVYTIFLKWSCNVNVEFVMEVSHDQRSVSTFTFKSQIRQVKSGKKGASKSTKLHSNVIFDEWAATSNTPVSVGGLLFLVQRFLCCPLSSFAYAYGPSSHFN